MTVAARLERYARGRLLPEILRHHRCRTAQKGEWARQHALIADRYQLRHAQTIGRRENRHRIAVYPSSQISVLFARDLLAQADAVVVSLGQRTRWGRNH